jgi:negative regulator of sigma-B (phosphoserine phosphatase)
MVEWGWAGRALEVVSGDLHVIIPFPGGVLVGLIDGLGHGYEAAEASIAASSLLAAHAGSAVLTLVQQCHEGLRKTRGVVMSLASFSALTSTMTWVGVGNVAGDMLRKQPGPGYLNRTLLTRAGVVGYQLPPLRAETLPVLAGDTLIFATDGIRGGFSTGLLVEESPQEIAHFILDRFARDTDDAHVVVARYIGDAA